MNISGNNIEKWFFDYFEGNLSQSQVKQLFLFLDEHPWHAEEFNNWKNTYNVPVHIKHTYAGKSSLIKKAPFTEYLKYAAVALLLFSLGSVTTYFMMAEGDSLQKGNTYAHESKDWTFLKSNATPVQSNNSLVGKNTEISSEQNHQNNTPSPSTAPVIVDDGSTAQNQGSKNKNEEEEFLGTTEEKNTNEIVSQSDIATHTSQNSSPRNNVSNNTSSQNELNVVKEELGHNNIGSIEEVETDEEFQLDENFQPVTSLVNWDKNQSLNSSLVKITDEEHAATYLMNPDFVSSEIELEFAKSGLKKSSQFKKFSKKLIRMLDDPIALTNLRDPNLVIPNYNPIQFNAAFAGSMYRGRWETMHRYQWHNSNSVQHQSYSSYDAYIKSIKGGVGIMAGFSDYNGGMYRDYEISLAYSPKIRITRNISFEPGINFNLGTKTLNSSKFNGQPIEWERGVVQNVFSSPEAVPGNMKLYRDMGAGALLNTKWFYAGFHANNIFEHLDNIYQSHEVGGFQRAPKRYTAVIGTDYQSFNNPNLIVSPFATYEQMGERRELWAGTNFRWNALLLGASLSNHLDYKATLGFQVNTIRMSYSYDQTYSWLAGESLPSHELNLKILIGKDYLRSRKTKY